MSDNPRHSESELRRMLASTPVEPAVDLSSVLRRSRARRLPRQLAAGAVGGLAVLGIGFAVVPALLPAGPGPAVMSEQAPAAGQPEQDAVLRLSAASLQLCGGPLAAQAEQSPSGLQLTLHVPTGVSAGGVAEGTARLSNGGTETLAGTASAPTAALARDGIVVWHTVQATGTVAFELAPGQSLELPVQLHALECGDEERLQSGAQLPPLASGQYQATLALDVLLGPDAVLLVSEPAAIEVR